MSRIKSKKYNGIYYQELMNNDKSYYITYKDLNGKKIGLLLKEAITILLLKQKIQQTIMRDK